MIKVDEEVAVLTNQAGEPIGFNWRNGKYLVTRKPERWFARRNWWLEAPRAQRGIGSSVLEVEMWRLSAAKKSCLATEFELLHDSQNRGWQLVRICS